MNPTETSQAQAPVISRQNHPLICRHSGIVIGSINVLKVAGHIPYLSQWKDSVAYHPLFSLPLGTLLQFSRNYWNHFCTLTDVDEKEERVLQVATLAILHKLSVVEQSTVWLPELQEVASNWSSILQLANWKAHLSSDRFKFPSVRISKFNAGIDLNGYLTDCWNAKREYESKVREGVEAERLRSAEIALASLRDDLSRKAPRSKKLLWKWFCQHLPSRYSRDLDEWMEDLYLAETEDDLAEFTIADIDLFEEIVLAEIPIGTSVSHAFLDRIRAKRTILEDKFKAFHIITPSWIEEEKAAGTVPTVEPLRSSYGSVAEFLVAQAKWRLSQTDLNKFAKMEAARQSTVTVNATPIPTILEESIPEPQDLFDLLGSSGISVEDADIGVSDDEENLQ